MPVGLSRLKWPGPHLSHAELLSRCPSIVRLKVPTRLQAFNGGILGILAGTLRRTAGVPPWVGAGFKNFGIY